MPGSAIAICSGTYLLFGLIGNHLLFMWLNQYQPKNRHIPVFLEEEWAMWLFPWPFAIIPAYLEKRLLEIAAA